MKQHSFTKTPLATGIALALGATSLSTAQAQDDSGPIEEVIVTGVRGSLASSANMKRAAQGVSDGIVAEDIGKFPDTNLAESLQRITGVSIDRTAPVGVPGEGSRVTVRGVGPDFNLVTLNGRQMPGSSLQATTASDSRSFDFNNIASEAVSAVQVYKTSQARLPTGGIGAVVDIETTRPLDLPDTVFTIGAKAVTDTSVENGDDWTPEVSGIYASQFADGKFGVAISGSYQERNLGFNDAGAASGFQSFVRGDDAGTWGGVPQPGDPNFTILENAPQDGDVYSVPQNILYGFNDVQRERINGQLTLQWAPTDRITATLDYTYSELEVQQQRAELSAWFNYLNNSTISFNDGPLPGPNVYSEQYATQANPAPGDVGIGGAEFGFKNENNSVGLNIEWLVTDQLYLSFDIHDSQAQSGRASPWGSNAIVGTAGFYRGTTTVDWSADLPALGLDFLAGTTSLDPTQHLITGSSFRNGLSDAQILQARIDGSFDFNDSFSLDFGVMTTEVDNRSAFSNVQNNTWGGAGTPADFDDSNFFIDPQSPASYFSNVPGSGNPIWTPELMRFDFAGVVADATAAGVGNFGASDDFDTDRRTTEDTISGYVQFNAFFDLFSAPAQVALGLRYEETDVVSAALVPIPTGVTWEAANEFNVNLSGESDFTTLEGSYDYVLPSLDFNVEVIDDVILRFGYSETIGRPGWGNIQGGTTLDLLARVNGGTGSSGNPALLPLESTNLDLSVEWYYGEGSYASLAFFTKDIKNFVTFTQVSDTAFDLPTPFGGARYNEALGVVGDDAVLIRDYICQNYANTPEVRNCAIDQTGFLSGQIDGIPGQDPALEFLITQPANASDSETLDGWEIALQHFFGDSGFGINVNYTMVEATTAYDNFNIGAQEPLLGISDSGNFIGFWENDTFSLKAAYNWRDEYLTGTIFGNGYQQPLYVEEYGQWDVNLGWNATDRLTLTLEGINVTDEYTRTRGRDGNVAFVVTTFGARYMIGARYDF
jgi:TonB-dependent receptor